MKKKWVSAKTIRQVHKPGTAVYPAVIDPKQKIVPSPIALAKAPIYVQKQAFARDTLL